MGESKKDLVCLKDRFRLSVADLEATDRVMAVMEQNCYHTSNAPGGYYQVICERCHQCPTNARMREAWLHSSR